MDLSVSQFLFISQFSLRPMSLCFIENQVNKVCYGCLKFLSHAASNYALLSSLFNCMMASEYLFQPSEYLYDILSTL